MFPENSAKPKSKKQKEDGGKSGILLILKDPNHPNHPDNPEILRSYARQFKNRSAHP